jgi:lipoprotein NlpI
MIRIAILLWCALAAWAQPAVTPLEKAVVEYRKRNYDAALEILDKAIKDQSDQPDYYALRGDIFSLRGQSSKAIENYDKMIELRPQNGAGFYRRAMEYFRMARMTEAIADFDKLAKLHPEREAELWQRGIAYYYAGEFEKGRKQFETHQGVNQQDVENAVWHLLCVAKIEGFEKARAQLIKISDDKRVPMKQIHAVFAGTAQPEDVIKAAQAGEPNGEQLQDRLFYAHLYLGLFEEARGNVAASLEHMRKAAGEYSQKHYMGDVARVHLALREKK